MTRAERCRRACADAAFRRLVQHLREAVPQMDQDIRSLEARGKDASLIRELRDATAEMLRALDPPRTRRRR